MTIQVVTSMMSPLPLWFPSHLRGFKKDSSNEASTLWIVTVNFQFLQDFCGWFQPVSNSQTICFFKARVQLLLCHQWRGWILPLGHVVFCCRGCCCLARFSKMSPPSNFFNIYTSQKNKRSWENRLSNTWCAFWKLCQANSMFFVCLCFHPSRWRQLHLIPTFLPTDRCASRLQLFITICDIDSQPLLVGQSSSY